MDENVGQIGKYRLIRKIAQGGMAEIFLANQTGPVGFNKTLVIKRILPHLAEDPKFVDMFLDEARIAAQFNHPNVVQIFDLGEVDEQYFIAMEYIDGYDLAQVAERASEFGRNVPPPVVARVIADALKGLNYAHTFKDPTTGEPLNLVHRDISPHNILVNKDGGAKIVDFGVAKAKTSSVKTQTGAVKGKFSYMAPEQIAGEELDGRVDLFAMGITLFELATGRRPFGSDNDLMALTAIINDPPPRPSEIEDGFPDDLEHIILKALEKDRDDRYPTALDMQRDLETYLQRTGLLISQHEVAQYIEDLFSDTPSLDSIGLGASQTASFSAIGGSMSTSQKSLAAAAAANNTSASKPTAQYPPLSDVDMTPPVEKSNSGLLIAVVIIALLVIGGGAYIFFVLLAEEDSSGADKAGATSDTAPADATSGEGPADTAVASAQPADTAQPEEDKDTAAAAPASDTRVAAATSPPDTASAGGGDDNEPGRPVKTPRGFGQVQVSSNLKATVTTEDGKTVGQIPGAITLPKGPNTLTFASPEGASRTASVQIFEQRVYDLDLPFKKGKLTVLTVPPGVSLKVNGKSVGKTPVKRHVVWEGVHSLELEYKGKRMQADVGVAPSIETKKTFSLK